MSLKSRVASESTIDNFYRKNKHVRMWTFTLPRIVDARHASLMWSALSRDLVRFLGFAGVRVFELHPGGHGLHVHVLTPYYFDVRGVRGLCVRHGWGRVNVKLIPSSDRYYICKYLAKSDRIYQGCRQWSTVGKKFIHGMITRVKDIQVRSTCHMIYKRMLPLANRDRKCWALKLWQKAEIYWLHGEYFPTLAQCQV